MNAPEHPEDRSVTGRVNRPSCDISHHTQSARSGYRTYGIFQEPPLPQVIRHSHVNGRRSFASGVTAATKIPARNRARNRRPRVLFVTDFYVEDVLLGIVDHA